MKETPKRLSPEEAVKFIDRQNNPRLIESRQRFLEGSWVMTLWPGGHWTFVSSPAVRVDT